MCITCVIINLRLLCIAVALEISKLKKGGGIRVENEKLKLTIKRLKKQAKDSEEYIDEIIRKSGERRLQ